LYFWKERSIFTLRQKEKKWRICNGEAPSALRWTIPLPMWLPVHLPAKQAIIIEVSSLKEAAFVKDRIKMKILGRMMEKYQPEGNDGEMSAEILGKTAVVEILIKEITGKEDFG
jgi:hypothetical protein